MDAAEARATLLRQLESDEDDTLLNWLRPYRGVPDDHLVEILHALFISAPLLNWSAEVDRILVHAVWELCRTVRAWTRGPREPMFHGLQFISPTEKKRLDSWVDKVESITLNLLRGRSISTAFLGLEWYVTEWGFGPKVAFLTPLFIARLQEVIEEGVIADDEINLCRALGSIGRAAREAAALIRKVGERSTDPNVKAAATEALQAIL